MCTVVVLLRPGAEWPLMVGANRDERLDRPFDPPARWWPDVPQIIGGHDKLGGGSWLGINDDGVFATIVNGMHRLGPLAGKRSRGTLVIDALRHATATSAADAMRALDPDEYRGFTLVLADRTSAYAVVNDEHKVDVAELYPGYHLVTPDGCDVVTSPRHRQYFPAFVAAPPPDPDADDWTSWIELLRTADEDDPHRGLTITGAEFGTVASTLFALPADRNRSPRLYFASGPPTIAAYQPIDASRVQPPSVESTGCS